MVTLPALRALSPVAITLTIANVKHIRSQRVVLCATKLMARSATTSDYQRLPAVLPLHVGNC